MPSRILGGVSDDEDAGRAGGAATETGDPGVRVRRLLGIISTIARLGLAAVWLISGYVKAADPVQTEVAIRAYRLLPASLEVPAATALPIVEILLGVFLLIGLATRWAAIASALVLLLLMAGIGWAWSKGYTIDCGCFGGGGENPDVDGRTYAIELARDTGFLVLALWLSVFPRSLVAAGPGSRA